ncbi:ornithine cyclodeaminase family protein [Paraburkholderia bryophila]|jgi:ornithine cyclodeaminase|uniref:Ornithine cyclodeaminase n=1 Tax=Paraburkholderia bryophila TaxID=420952 RepID=A0A329C5Y6_9BURK|nr:ornithine cyclodeaminase family protein [Paraburkholderia bryophila]RAS26415.1 ornithine cyclodeaminase [Paraburkholderia bryophila]
MPIDAHLLLLDKDQVERLMQPADVMEAVKEAFVLHSNREGRVFPVVRESLATGGIFGIKSGDVPSQGLLGFKAAGFWPDNRKRGGEPHQATVMLMDPATGRPLCMIDGNAITTLRTGAAGAWGLQTLARADSTSVCVFGAGVQAAIQLRFALDNLPTLGKVRYVTHDGQPNASFEAAFSARCAISLAADKNEAVSTSDIVITATPGAGALFDTEAVQAGTHLNCVGADTQGKRELPDGLLARVTLVVDDREQAKRIGETQWAPSTPSVELGDLLTGKETCHRQPTEITLFDMTGLALQDLTVARGLYRRALAERVGSSIPWPW